MKKLISNIIRPLFIPFIKRKDLKNGITALVCCRDEDYNIELCLKSLSTLVDQIICVDHNSSDNTWIKMKKFQADFEHKLDVEVLKFEGASLKDARNYGLSYAKYSWLLNSGGDFVFFNDDDNLNSIFKNLRNSSKLEAYQLTFVNLYGDLKHTYKNYNVVSLGENYIVKITKNVKFVESGKFDYLSFPFFYKQKSIHKPSFFHLSGLKSDERLLYRDCYFEWREILNFYHQNGVLNSPYENFSTFADYWNLYLFNTTDRKSLKYRMQRQLCEIEYKPYDEKEYFPYPTILKDLINQKNERFKVEYKNGKPYYRRDFEDNEMLHYIPTLEDENWSVLEFNEKHKNKNYLKTLKNSL